MISHLCGRRGPVSFLATWTLSSYPSTYGDLAMIALNLLVVVSASLWLVNALLSKLHVASTRFSVSLSSIHSLYSAFIVPGLAAFTMGSLLLRIGCLNLLGSIPGVVNPNMYYFFTSGVSLSLWLVVVVLVVKTQVSSFVAHLLPYGTPAGLALILPVIELFRFLIRPFTLMVRLRTNLSSGHIMMFIFSYFALASKSLPSLSLLMGGLMFLLYRLELFVCLLQAYIFASLLALYYKETI